MKAIQKINYQAVKLSLIFCLLCFARPLHGQDIIFKTDGTTIETKVLEINPDNIRYNRYENPEGPRYTILKNEVIKIKYENGTEEIFAAEEAKKEAAEPKQNSLSHRESIFRSYKPYQSISASWLLDRPTKSFYRSTYSFFGNSLNLSLVIPLYKKLGIATDISSGAYAVDTAEITRLRFQETNKKYYIEHYPFTIATYLIGPSYSYRSQRITLVGAAMVGAAKFTKPEVREVTVKESKVSEKAKETIFAYNIRGTAQYLLGQNIFIQFSIEYLSANGTLTYNVEEKGWDTNYYQRYSTGTLKPELGHIGFGFGLGYAIHTK